MRSEICAQPKCLGAGQLRSRRPQADGLEAWLMGGAGLKEDQEAGLMDREGLEDDQEAV